jgi:hypothetical protein
MKRAGPSDFIVLEGLLVDPYLLMFYSENSDNILYTRFGCHLYSGSDIRGKELSRKINLHSNFKTRTDNILKDPEKVARYFQKVSQDFLYGSFDGPRLLLTPQDVDLIYRPLILEVHNKLLEEKKLK